MSNKYVVFIQKKIKAKKNDCTRRWGSGDKKGPVEESQRPGDNKRESDWTRE